MQGAMRYFKGLKPLSQLRDVDRKRVQLSAQAPGQVDFQEAEVVETDEGQGIGFKAGVSYVSVSSGEEKFVSLETLERGHWDQSSDIDRDSLVSLTYGKGTLDRLTRALSKLRLAVEIYDPVYETKPGQRVLVAVEAVLEDETVRRGIAKIAFNYLRYTTSGEFALRSAFDDIRNYIRNDTVPTRALVNRVGQIHLYGDHEEAAQRGGHTITLDMAPEGKEIIAFVEFFGAMTYKIRIGAFEDSVVPISAGHYFDYTEKQVFEMDAIRRPPELWIP